jgi:hypothetical protein
MNENNKNANKKIALCFTISYDHILIKEELWREWIEPNLDIINIYFFYKDYTKIKSEWIKKHCIPAKYIRKTSYFHVIPAYVSLIRHGLDADSENQWFCFLTDSCCPIIRPAKFRELFFANSDKSIMKWSKADWNIRLHQRANLRFLKANYHLRNDPWFTLTREHAVYCLETMKSNLKLTELICSGGLASESLFAIILYKQPNLINASSHLTDWSRMTSATSPYIFSHWSNDSTFVLAELDRNPYYMFIRKVTSEFIPWNIV